MIYFKNIGVILAFISTFVGAMATIVYKPLMQKGISPLFIGIIEPLTVLICLALFIKWRKIKKLRFSEKVIMFTGAFFQGVGTFSSYLALSYLDAITFSFLGRNQVTISILLGYFFLNEKHNIIMWIFLVMSLIGSMLLCYSDLTGKSYIGIFFTLLACFSYSLRGYILRRYYSYNTFCDIFYSYLVTIILVFTTILLKKKEIMNVLPSMSTIFIISFTSIFSVVASSYFYMKALNYEKLSLVSSIRLFSPYFVTIYFIVFCNYQFQILNFYGIILMSIAILLFVAENFKISVFLSKSSKNRKSM